MSNSFRTNDIFYLPMNLHRDYPVITEANGRYLKSIDGRIFLDAVSGGVGAVNIGHSVPEILKAIEIFQE